MPNQTRLSIYLLGCFSLAAQTSGTKAPAMQIEATPKPLALEQFVQEAPAAILALKTIPPDLCDTFKRLASAVSAERVRLVLHTSELSPPCGRITGVHRVASPPLDDKLTGLRLLVVDTSATIRLSQQVPLTAQSLDGVAKLVVNWESGRQIFITQCGHCHGDDGADTSYPGVKTMAGISKRMSAARILEGGQQFGAVDMSSWSQAVKDVLLLYISGL